MTSRYTNLLCCMIAFHIALLLLTPSASADDVTYDPEQQDGIPVISAKSIHSPSAFDWTLDSALQVQPTQRRSAINDEDDDNDEDDRDEEKSGSSNHDSFENPAFGESRTAARDGQDIEQFFDKHLGPQDATESSTGDEQDVPVISPSSSDEYDDHFDAAASSPLATIFQTIINAHKKPLIIQASEDDSTNQAGDQSSSSASGQQLNTPTSASAASSPLKSVANGVAAAYLGATPIAYITPMASNPSPMGAYEQQASPDLNAEASPSEEDDYGQVREVYISRRPSIFGRFQEGYGPTTGQTAAHIRETPIGAASGRIPQDYQQDFSRYPTAASYQQPQDSADDGQTVSYNLSFGGGSAESPDDPVENTSSVESSSPDEQTNSDDRSYSHQMHYNRNMMHHPSSTVQMYQNQHPAGMVPASFGPRLHSYSQQSNAFNGARYHRDPSEYQAYQQRYSALRDNGRAPSRRQLLAQLDQQIKNTPHYRQSVAASTPSYSHKLDSILGSGKQAAIKQRIAGGDLDTYSSYHSEADPYKTYTSTSRIVNEPDHQMALKSQGQQAISSSGKNLLMGPLTRVQEHADSQQPQFDSGDLMRNNPSNRQVQSQVNLRVRRDDSDERDAEDADDDGVWVDDDEDDDIRQQSSDVNETSQEPEGQSADPVAPNGIPKAIGSGIVNQPHGFELSPDDLMVYHG